MSARPNLATDGNCKRRDERHRVLIRAQMRAGGRPVDVCIRDVSLRGICLVTNAPLPRGTVVELTGTSIPIVGQVMWSTDRRCGVAVGGKIDLPRLLAQRPTGPAPHETVPLPAYARAPLPPARPAEEKSRERGRAMQFGFTALLGIAAAGLIGGFVYDALSSVSGRIETALEARG